MRFVTAATRRLIALAVALHLLTLRWTVKLAQKAHNCHVRNTDAARLAVNDASQRLAEARDQRRQAVAAEDDSRRRFNAIASAADEESRKLSRV